MSGNQGQQHLTVIMILSAALSYSPINSKFSVQVGSRRADAKGALLHPRDTEELSPAVTGLAGAHLGGTQSPLEGEAFPCSGLVQTGVNS